jgi:TonB family protein
MAGTKRGSGYYYVVIAIGLVGALAIASILTSGVSAISVVFILVFLVLSGIGMHVYPREHVKEFVPPESPWMYLVYAAASLGLFVLFIYIDAPFKLTVAFMYMSIVSLMYGIYLWNRKVAKKPVKITFSIYMTAMSLPITIYFAIMRGIDRVNRTRTNKEETQKQEQIINDFKRKCLDPYSRKYVYDKEISGITKDTCHGIDEAAPSVNETWDYTEALELPLPECALDEDVMVFKGTTEFLVHIDRGGHVSWAKLVESCGRQELDLAAYVAARHARFVAAPDGDTRTSATLYIHYDHRIDRVAAGNGMMTDYACSVYVSCEPFTH